MTTSEKLEQWLFSSKIHSMSLAHDNGYGASCWELRLTTKDGDNDFTSEDEETLDQLLQRALETISK